ncbi:hypothetical protein RPC_0913 [Rhodopseudomonas palustris BisB18]|uniref:Uncharacterized protein n=1 Tax=Rhodopseudomonas palustris (strain BisB18) TaxID=316056 RepID=Q21AV3_RHOPB
MRIDYQRNDPTNRHARRKDAELEVRHPEVLAVFGEPRRTTDRMSGVEIHSTRSPSFEARRNSSARLRMTAIALRAQQWRDR